MGLCGGSFRSIDGSRRPWRRTIGGGTQLAPVRGAAGGVNMVRFGVSRYESKVLPRQNRMGVPGMMNICNRRQPKIQVLLVQ